MALHRTDTLRAESVRIATRLGLARAKHAATPPPTIAEICADADQLNAFLTRGKTLDQLVQEKAVELLQGSSLTTPPVLRALRGKG